VIQVATTARKASPKASIDAADSGPRQLRCHAQLEAGGRKIDCVGLEVTVSGIARLPELGTSPALAPGQPALARLSLADPAPGEAGAWLQVPGRFVLERTLAAASRGFAFDWRGCEQSRRLLEAALAERGVPGEPNRRKHERFAVGESDRTFPCLATIRLGEASAFDGGARDSGWPARIDDLSVAGMRVSSRAPGAASVKPGDSLQISLEPRDLQGFAIELLGQVRRVLELADPRGEPGTLTRSFGVRFEWFDEDQRTVYLGLLKCLKPEK
jgi:hypothetical protein